MRYVTMAICMLSAGCGATTILLQHPKTKQIVQCTNADQPMWGEGDAGKCARLYEAQGYERVPD